MNPDLKDDKRLRELAERIVEADAMLAQTRPNLAWQRIPVSNLYEALRFEMFVSHVDPDEVDGSGPFGI
jgi:hypothetical protein